LIVTQSGGLTKTMTLAGRGITAHRFGHVECADGETSTTLRIQVMTALILSMNLSHFATAFFVLTISHRQKSRSVPFEERSASRVTAFSTFNKR
jgi:hypothetical protein